MKIPFTDYPHRPTPVTKSLTILVSRKDYESTIFRFKLTCFFACLLSFALGLFFSFTIRSSSLNEAYLNGQRSVLEARDLSNPDSLFPKR